MKKIIASIFLVLPVLAYGQHKLAKLPLLEIDYAVETAQHNTVVNSWKKKLQHIQEMFARVPSKSQLQFSTPAILASSLNYKEEQTYLQRMLVLQKQVNQNTALKGFTFVAPVPEDLARFSAANYTALQDFLKDSPSVSVLAEQERPFTLTVHVRAITSGALELWIDEPTKKIYLMSDNFYSTSAGKYSLHLR